MTTAAQKNAAVRKNLDPLGVSRRLYKQIDLVLKDLEGIGRGADFVAVTPAQRVSALKAIAQIMILQQTLRIKESNDPGRAGSSVRKYSTAFKTNAARRRAVDTGANVVDIADVIAELNDAADDDDGDDAGESTS
jgi:hypothetical protein